MSCGISGCVAYLLRNFSTLTYSKITHETVRPYTYDYSRWKFSPKPTRYTSYNMAYKNRHFICHLPLNNTSITSSVIFICIIFRNSSVSKETYIRAGKQSRGSSPHRGNIFFASPKCPTGSATGPVATGESSSRVNRPGRGAVFPFSICIHGMHRCFTICLYYEQENCALSRVTDETQQVSETFDSSPAVSCQQRDKT